MFYFFSFTAVNIPGCFTPESIFFVFNSFLAFMPVAIKSSVFYFTPRIGTRSVLCNFRYRIVNKILCKSCSTIYIMNFLGFFFIAIVIYFNPMKLVLRPCAHRQVLAAPKATFLQRPSLIGFPMLWTGPISGLEP